MIALDQMTIEGPIPDAVGYDQARRRRATPRKAAPKESLLYVIYNQLLSRSAKNRYGSLNSPNGVKVFP